MEELNGERYKDNFLEYVNNLVSRLYFASNRKELFGEILRAAVEIADADSSSLVIYTDENDSLVYDFYKDVGRITFHRRIANLISGISTRVIKDRKVHLYKNTDKDIEHERIFNRDGLKAIIASPILLMKKITGILYIRYTRSGPDMRILDDLKKKLKLISTLTATAYGNFKLYEELNTSIKKLKLSYNFSKKLAKCKNIENLADRIIGELKNRFDFKHIKVYLKREKEDCLVLSYASGEGEKFIGEEVEIGAENPVGRVAEQNRILNLWKNGSSESEYGVNAKPSIIIPLSVGERLHGVLCIEGDRGESSSRDKLEILKSLSLEISIALEKSIVYQKARELSRRDYLTGVLNRREIEEAIETEISNSKRYNNIFSLLFIDLDNFKRFNDRYGHSKGDKTLVHYCNCMKEILRAGDVFGRYGGDEFIALLQLSNVDSAREVAERLISRVRRESNYPDLSISVGISVFSENGETLKELIGAADRACYDAKNEGGDRYKVAEK